MNLLSEPLDRFHQQIELLLNLLKQHDSETSEVFVKLVSEHGDRLQAIFQTELLSKSESEDHRRLSYLVEINKQLRLLHSDFSLMGAARNRTTRSQRLQKISARLELLFSYCESLKEL